LFGVDPFHDFFGEDMVLVLFLGHLETFTYVSLNVLEGSGMLQFFIVTVLGILIPVVLLLVFIQELHNLFLKS